MLHMMRSDRNGVRNRFDEHGRITDMSSVNGKAMASLILSIIIWSVSFIATKIACQCFTPLTLCFIRLSVAAVILLVIRIVRKQPFTLSGKDRRPVFLSAFLGITVYYALETIGVSLTSASNASVITAFYPLSTVVTGMLFFHDRIPLRQLIGILIGIAGIIVLTETSPSESGRNVMAGNLLLLFNGFMWGSYNYLTQEVSSETDTETMTFFQTIAGAVFFLPVLLLDMPIHIARVTPEAAASLLFLSAGCSVIAYYLYNYGLRGVSAVIAASSLNLMPVFGLFFSWLILHEPIGVRQIFGTVLVISGVMLSAYLKSGRKNFLLNTSVSEKSN